MAIDPQPLRRARADDGGRPLAPVEAVGVSAPLRGNGIGAQLMGARK